MNPNYENWVPKKMVVGLFAGAGAALLFGAPRRAPSREAQARGSKVAHVFSKETEKNLEF